MIRPFHLTGLLATLVLGSCTTPVLTVRAGMGGPTATDFHPLHRGVVPHSKIDPRFHPPRELGEIDYLASRIVRANDLPLRGRIVEDANRTRLASIRHSGGPEATIYVHPRAARTVPINSWAFILGHELAHQTLGTGGDPQSELEADLLGADYAARAGFDPAAYLAWIMAPGNHFGGQTHLPHPARVEAIGRALRVPANEVHRLLR